MNEQYRECVRPGRAQSHSVYGERVTPIAEPDPTLRQAPERRTFLSGKGRRNGSDKHSSQRALCAAANIAHSHARPACHHKSPCIRVAISLPRLASQPRIVSTKLRLSPGFLRYRIEILPRNDPDTQPLLLLSLYSTTDTTHQPGLRTERQSQDLQLAESSMKPPMPLLRPQVLSGPRCLRLRVGPRGNHEGVDVVAEGISQPVVGLVRAEVQGQGHRRAGRQRDVLGVPQLAVRLWPARFAAFITSASNASRSMWRPLSSRVASRALMASCCLHPSGAFDRRRVLPPASGRLPDLRMRSARRASRCVQASPRSPCAAGVRPSP